MASAYSGHTAIHRSSVRKREGADSATANVGGGPARGGWLDESTERPSPGLAMIADEGEANGEQHGAAAAAATEPEAK